MRQVSISASGAMVAQAGFEARWSGGGSDVEASMGGKCPPVMVKAVSMRGVSPEVRWNRGGIRPVSRGAEGGGKRKSP